MSTSRRSFLKNGTLVALAAGVPLGLAEKVVPRNAIATPAAGLGLTQAGFEAQLNTKFLINEGSAKVEVKLVEVTGLRSLKVIAREKEGFSLLFRGSQATNLKQQTYLIEHPKLGLFSFLIVPVMSKDESARYYEAVINRLYP